MISTKGDKKIIVLSSALHLSGKKKILFDDINMKGSEYGGFDRYAHSKLANVMFARELNKKLEKDGADIKCYSVHPGIIKTELHRYHNIFVRSAEFLFSPLLTFFRKNIEQGAATTIFALVCKDVKGGSYLENCGVGKELGYALNDGECEKLWNVSEELTKTYYPKSLLIYDVNRTISF
jgi:hypothetical protein